ncbi:MAG: bifunctional 4-hydroxy-2-oxoglutarate aldolase/2-dehydro-3-deoxy-phosphogluconate aldolase [Opitutaceae bacterium]|nr:bifunctional 4-hydroxy-2-oxoglutarate aldolase/2-dehydro-3-deoxy-phosphogluconate aldolase [Opitutaceae bacterium]
MPLIAILRNLAPSAVEPVALALRDAGITALEVTMNTPDAAAQIRAAAACVGNTAAVGAGTVTSLEELACAQAAGASFVVTPVVIPDVITACVRCGLPVFPGAFTPGEVFEAHRLGATMVKLFPASRLGPGYIRDLRGPFPKIPLLATGGITPETMPEYIAAGAAGFGISGPLFPPERVKAGDWAWVKNQAARFCAAWQQARNR